MRKMKTPMEIYAGDEKMPEFVMEVIEDLLIQNRRNEVFLPIIIRSSKIKKRLEKRAKEHGVEYRAKWLKLCLLQFNDKWIIDVEDFGNGDIRYSFTPINITYSDYSRSFRDEDD